MLERLVLNNFPTGTEPKVLGDESHFYLKTCQRTLVLSLDNDPTFFKTQNKMHFRCTGKDAYLFLLETICGLKSKLVGENEIVGQFKDAFKVFLHQEYKDKELIRILEKLFKDAKEIRSKYLLGLSQKTYASITRRNICNRHKAESVLILGSGNLAEDLINQFKKKAKIYIAARNKQRLNELSQIHELDIVEWDNRFELVKHPFIANTIGADQVLFNSDFFDLWADNHDKKLFVDLGSPTCLDFADDHNEHVMLLEDIFKEGAVAETHKLKQIEKAKDAINIIIDKRHTNLSNRIKRNIKMSQYKETEVAR